MGFAERAAELRAKPDKTDAEHEEWRDLMDVLMERDREWKEGSDD